MNFKNYSFNLTNKLNYKKMNIAEGGLQQGIYRLFINEYQLVYKKQNLAKVQMNAKEAMQKNLI